MTNEELAAFIRCVSDRISVATPHNIAGLVMPLRGIAAPNCHVGRGDEMDGSDAGYRMQLEWYAGQLLGMVDERAWHGVNSWINCTDKFTTRREK